MNLNGILIGSEDPQRLTAYYTRLFGEPGWAGGDFRGWIATLADPDDNYFQLVSPIPS
jgi:hypothetical protein